MNDGFEAVRAGDATEFRPSPAGVRQRAAVASVAAGVLAAAALAALVVLGFHAGWPGPAAAAVLTPAVVAAAYRRARADGRAALTVGPDGRVEFRGDEVVGSHQARAVWVERRADDDGGVVAEYLVCVARADGLVWLPLPDWGAWDGRAGRRPAFGCADRGRAGRYAAAVAAALGVPVTGLGD